MRIYPPLQVIGEFDGFTDENDLFGRRPLAKGLQNLVAKVTDPMVLAIDGAWGSGKSTFLQRWAAGLRRSGFPVIYFDAFAKDYVEDAFTALAAEIVALVEAHGKQNTKEAKSFVKNAKAAGRIVGRSALRAASKGVTIGLLDGVDLSDEIIKTIADQAESLVDKSLGGAITKQKEQETAPEAFTTALSALPTILIRELPPGESIPDSESRPLIFIIDELDRCRPSFSLQLLERIKHFFAVPGIHFVLGTHVGQLANSVQAAYGAQLDGHSYLQKFIHFTVTLNDEPPMGQARNLIKYINQLAKSLSITNADRGYVEEAIEFISAIGDAQGISFRQAERIMTHLALSTAFSSRQAYREATIVSGLCMLKVLYTHIYHEAKSGTLKWGDLTSTLLSKPVKDIHFNKKYFYGYWQFCVDSAAPKSILDDFTQGPRRMARERVVPYMATHVVESISVYGEG